MADLGGREAEEAGASSSSESSLPSWEGTSDAASGEVVRGSQGAPASAAPGGGRGRTVAIQEWQLEKLVKALKAGQEARECTSCPCHCRVSESALLEDDRLWV